MPLCPASSLPARNYTSVTNAAARPVTPIPGTVVYQMDVSAAFRWDGIQWVRLGEYGFHVVRTSNDASIPNNTQDDLTFNKIVRNTGFIPGPFDATPFLTDSFTVPADGTGIYVMSTGCYWGSNRTLVYLGVAVNRNKATASVDEVPASSDRQYSHSVASLTAGDVVRAHIANLSGSALTPTVVTGDIRTQPLPYLSVWRL